MKTLPERPLPRPSDGPGTAAPPARQLTPTEFNTAMVHLYRGEVGRANTWRTRLDGTTNWAVLTAGATLSFAFSSVNNSHVMILINSLLTFFFLYIEARRYMFYDLWRSRVRLMEIEFFAEMLTPGASLDSASWRQLLANDLLYPRFSVSLWNALGRRLRRNYIWIFGVLVISWMVKVLIHPTTPTSLSMLLNRISIGPIPAWLVLLIGVLFNGFIAYLAFGTIDRATQDDDDETLPRHETRQRMGAGESPEQ